MICVRSDQRNLQSSTCVPMCNEWSHGEVCSGCVRLCPGSTGTAAHGTPRGHDPTGVAHTTDCAEREMGSDGEPRCSTGAHPTRPHRCGSHDCAERDGERWGASLHVSACPQSARRPMMTPLSTEQSSPRQRQIRRRQPLLAARSRASACSLPARERTRPPLRPAGGGGQAHSAPQASA